MVLSRESLVATVVCVNILFLLQIPPHLLTLYLVRFRAVVVPCPFFLLLLMLFAIPINSTLNPLCHYPHPTPSFSLSVPSFNLCGSQLAEVFNPAFELCARKKRGEGTAFLLRCLSVLSAPLFLRCAHPASS